MQLSRFEPIQYDRASAKMCFQKLTRLPRVVLECLRSDSLDTEQMFAIFLNEDIEPTS